MHFSWIDNWIFYISALLCVSVNPTSWGRKASPSFPKLETDCLHHPLQKALWCALTVTCYHTSLNFCSCIINSGTNNNRWLISNLCMKIFWLDAASTCPCQEAGPSEQKLHSLPSLAANSKELSGKQHTKHATFLTSHACDSPVAWAYTHLHKHFCHWVPHNRLTQ